MLSLSFITFILMMSVFLVLGIVVHVGEARRSQNAKDKKPPVDHRDEMR